MPAKHISHPYIVSLPDWRGGAPIIRGTNFPVHSVVNYVLHQGMTPEELVAEFMYLNLSQVYDALSYYHDFQAEIDQKLAEGTEEYLYQEFH